jgi:SAM-dependent methyltransferase
MTALSRWTVEVADYDIAHLRLRQVAVLVGSLDAGRHSGDRGVVVDLGCGRGTLRRLLDAARWRYVGCDFVASPRDGDGAPFEFHRCDFNVEPLPPSLPRADVLVCSGLLEYVADIPSLLQQARGLLTDDGALVVSYVNMSHLLRVVDSVRGRTMFHHPDWRGFWSPRDVVAQIDAGGFTVESTYETTRGVRPEPAFAATVDAPVRLRRAGWSSRWLAHELLFVARPAQTTGDHTLT